MRKLLLTAGAAALLGALSVHAQVASGMNDLVLGFKSTSETTNLMINLGSFAQFDSAGGTEAKSWSLDISSLLTTAYGSDWNTQAGLNWGIAGTQGAQDAEKTSYVSSQWAATEGTLGVKNSTAWGAINSMGSGNAAANIGKAYNGMTLASAAATIASNAVIIETSNANSWSSATTSTGAAFSIYNPQTRFQNQTTNLAAGETFSASDLYKMDYGVAGQFEGTFSLDQNGTLSFTAIPEPSTYAMILGAFTLGFIAIRRRMVKQV
jgi:hypothetical protein